MAVNMVSSSRRRCGCGSAPLLALATSLLVCGTAGNVNTAQGTGGGASAIDPDAFAASTPLPKRALEGVFAGFSLHLLVGGVSEEYLGKLNRDKEPTPEEKHEVMKEVYRMAGEMYRDECLSEGLSAPENITNIPVSKELVRPAYYAKYLYAINRVAFEVMGNRGMFDRYRDRIAGRVFDAVVQYVQFSPSHDMDDIKGMRKSLPKFLSQYCTLGLAAEAGAMFPKGMDKKWAAGEPVTFKVWVEAPILKAVNDRLSSEIGGGFRDWMFYIVQRFFTSYLVDAELVKEYPSDTDPYKIIQEWKIEQM